MATKPIAAIDIGSNSMHLIVARMCPNGTFEHLDSHKVTTRLAAYLDSSGKLSEEGINVLLKTLQEMKSIASGYDPEFRVIATHATRTSKNRKTIIARAYQELGLSIEVIDGLEEARLASLGMASSLSLKNQSFLGLDIGGGSTEIIYRNAQKQLERCASLQIGTVALQKMFESEEGPTDLELKRLKEILHNKITPLASEVESMPRDTTRLAVACSGTAKAAANLIHQMKFGRPLLDANAFVFNATELHELTASLESLRSPKAIRAKYTLDKDRSEVVLVGMEILVAITDHLKISKWSVSTYGLREGIILDSAQQAEASSDSFDPRMESIRSFARRYRVDEPQVERVQNFAVSIYNQIGHQTAGYNVLQKDELLLLKAGSWLHEVGKFVAYSKYHRHSHYLIANGTLQGYTEKERLAIALICRFHRKRNALINKDDFESFTEPEAKRIVTLSAILRLSASLARGRRECIQSVQATVQGSNLVLEVVAARDQNPDVELARVREELFVLESGLQKTILISRRSIS
ncbi:MAG: Ppx/GppA phosphatase family protein [Pseudomonadota bacterium]